MMMHKKRHSIWLKTIALGVVCLFLCNSVAYESSFVAQSVPAASTHNLGIAVGDILGLRNRDTERIKWATVGLLKEMIPDCVTLEGVDLRREIEEHKDLLQDRLKGLNREGLMPFVFNTSASAPGDNWCMRWWVKDGRSEEPRAYVAEFPRTSALEVRVYPEQDAGEAAGAIPKFDKGIPANFIKFYKDAWEQKLQEGIIEFDPREIKREKKVFRRNIIVLNERRAYSRRKQIKSFREVPEQVICEILINGKWYQILVNKYPTFPYQGLFVRKSYTRGHPQIMTEEAVLDFLTLQRKIPAAVHGVFNSRGAGYSIDEFHIKFHLREHLTAGMDQLPVAKRPITTHREEGNVSIGTLGDDHPSANLVFLGGTNREESSVIGSYLTDINNSKIPHNVIFLDNKIYLFLRNARRECSFTAGAEHMGFWEVFESGAFERVNSDATLEDRIRDTALPKALFEKLKYDSAHRDQGSYQRSGDARVTVDKPPGAVADEPRAKAAGKDEMLPIAEGAHPIISPLIHKITSEKITDRKEIIRILNYTLTQAKEEGYTTAANSIKEIITIAKERTWLTASDIIKEATKNLRETLELYKEHSSIREDERNDVEIWKSIRVAIEKLRLEVPAKLFQPEKLSGLNSNVFRPNLHAKSVFKGSEKKRIKLLSKTANCLLEVLDRLSTSENPGYVTEKDERLIIDLSKLGIIKDGIRIGKIEILNPPGFTEEGCVSGKAVFYMPGRDELIGLDLDNNTLLQDLISHLFFLVDGSEIEKDYSRGYGPSLPKDDGTWDDWTEHDNRWVFLDSKDPYPDLHQAVIQSVTKILRYHKFRDRRDVLNILDLAGADGMFIYLLNQVLFEAGKGGKKPAKDIQYFLIDRNQKCIDAAHKLLERTNTVVKQHDITKLDSISRDLGTRLHIVTCIGGITKDVMKNSKDASLVARKVYDALVPGGIFIVTGGTQVFLNSEDFERIGFEVINTSLPRNFVKKGAHRKIQLYILQKPQKVEHYVKRNPLAMCSTETIRYGRGNFYYEIKKLAERLSAEHAEDSENLYRCARLSALIHDDIYVRNNAALTIANAAKTPDIPIEIILDHFLDPINSHSKLPFFYGLPEAMKKAEFNPALVSRNKRYALLKVIAEYVGGSHNPEASEVKSARMKIKQILEEQAEKWKPENDVNLLKIISMNPSLALGSDAISDKRFTLLELMRLDFLQSQVIEMNMHYIPRHRYDVHEILRVLYLSDKSAHQDKSRVTQIIYAPIPDVTDGTKEPDASAIILEEAKREIDEMIPVAERVHPGLVKKLPEGKTRIIVDEGIFEAGALKKDITGRLLNGRYIAAGDICMLEKCNTSKVDDIIRTLKKGEHPAQRTIVQVSSKLSSEDIDRLKQEAPEGVRFMRVDTNALDVKYNGDLDTETRWKLRFSLYATLLAARDITDEDIALKEASPAYRMLHFFLKTHGVKNPDSYIEELARDNLAFLINYALSFIPTEPWSKAIRYYLIGIRYVSGAA